MSLAGLALGGCKDLTGNQPLPSGTSNPSNFNTPIGAVELRTKAVYDLEVALPNHFTQTGLLTDELQSTSIGASTSAFFGNASTTGAAVDARILPAESYGVSIEGNKNVDQDYLSLQQVRGELNLALGAIAAYDTGAKAVGDPRVLRAELFALQGYTEILLADFFCSGVPLSTFDFQRDYTYHAGSTTAEVYQDAIAKEDSALALADTSTTIQYLARVLKGRALVNLDSVPAAAQVVAPVPDGFLYRLAVDSLRGRLNGTVADTEGQNGLPYLSSHDPRTAVTVVHFPDPLHGVFVTQTVPTKYSQTGFSPFVVASAVEARLIQAEAALRANANDPSWLTALNTLRTTGTYSGIAPPDTTPADTIRDTLGVTGCHKDQDGQAICGYLQADGSAPLYGQPAGYPSPDYNLVKADTTYPAPSGIQAYCAAYSRYEPCSNGDTMVVLTYVRPQRITSGDTLWIAGTGGVGRLRPLSDPGAALSGSAADSARVALLFRERAFWLFLTGERQGDLRRLLRQDRQWFANQNHVYPTGTYTGSGSPIYGTDVTAPIPGAEYLNPLFHGCLDRNP